MFLISADFWHEVRQEIRRRFGEQIFVLGQCSAAGDQSPHVLLCKQSHQRMWDLSGKTERENIAVRIADGVQRVLPYIEKDINYQPEFCMIHKTLYLTPYSATQQELKECQVEARKYKKEYEKMKQEIEKTLIKNPATLV